MDNENPEQESSQEDTKPVAYESTKQAKLNAQKEIDTLTAEFLKNGNKVTELPPSGIRKDYVGKVVTSFDYMGGF